MSSVFVPPDIQTVTNAAAAALASENICAQIAAGLSSSPYAYMLDGVSPAAIMSAPKGLFTLNGAQVPLSSLLSFSSGQKYTVGPDGNYMLNAANGPAWDWSSGRRRLLIEGIGSQNYWLHPEDATLWYGVAGSPNIGTPVSAANGLLGLFNLVTITASGEYGGPAAGQGLTTSPGDVLTFTIAMQGTADLTTHDIGMYDTNNAWGLSANSVASILSGPGAVTRNNGALFSVSGLQIGVTTFVRITRTFVSGDGAGTPLTYPRSASNIAAAGQTYKWGMPQFERGYGSSYIPNNSARPADIVTAASGLLALLTGANATLVIRGKRLGANPASSVDPLIGSTNRIASVEAGLYNAFAVSAAIDVLSAAPTATPISDVGVAVSWTAGQRKMAVNGGAVAKDNFALFSASDSGLQLFRGADGYANGYLDELSLWPIYASDAGLGAHARVYA